MLITARNESIFHSLFSYVCMAIKSAIFSLTSHFLKKDFLLSIPLSVSPFFIWLFSLALCLFISLAIDYRLVLKCSTSKMQELLSLLVCY